MTAAPPRKSTKRANGSVPAAPYQPTEKDNQALAALKAHQDRSPPTINLKVLRTDGPCQIILDYPDQIAGQAHLMEALGITDHTLALSILTNFSNLANRSKDFSQLELNSLLCMVRGIGPTDPLEALLAVQMAAIHSATLEMARTLKHTETIEQQDSASNSLNKLARTFAAQVEALKRHRSSSEQTVNVKHVHVHAGGQAVVGNVATEGVGDGKIEQQPHGPNGQIAGSPKMLSHVQADRAVMPISGRAGQERVPVSRSTRRGS